jgi:hypothetical protein
VAAVASLSARSAKPRDLLRVAGAWGLGHALTLIAAALIWAASGFAIEPTAQPYVEVAAGLLLVALGVDLLRKREAGWTRVVPHQHPDGTLHVHLHFRPEPGADRGVMSRHPHPTHPLRRALLVGSVHGLAGSALIGLLAAGGLRPGQTIAYAAVFGVGATAGMIVLSTVIALPLRSARVQTIAAMQCSRVAIAAVSIAIGIWISWQSVASISSPSGA